MAKMSSNRRSAGVISSSPLSLPGSKADLCRHYSTGIRRGEVAVVGRWSGGTWQSRSHLASSPAAWISTGSTTTARACPGTRRSSIAGAATPRHSATAWAASSRLLMARTLSTPATSSIPRTMPAGGDRGVHPWRLFGGRWTRRSSATSPAACKLHGVTVAIPNYRLCPEVALADIIDDVRMFAIWLKRRTGRSLVVSGHSAGAHLAACLDGDRLGRPRPAGGFRRRRSRRKRHLRSAAIAADRSQRHARARRAGGPCREPGDLAGSGRAALRHRRRRRGVERVPAPEPDSRRQSGPAAGRRRAMPRSPASTISTSSITSLIPAAR